MKIIKGRTILSEVVRVTLVGCLAFALESCSSFQNVEEGESVVYALGSRSGFPSPLTQSLKPVAPALEFAEGQFQTTAAHERILKSIPVSDPKSTVRYLAAGYAKPGLPPEYARVLAERRAHAVRQRLIELGLQPTQVQTAGYGNDFPKTGPTSDVVVIYQANP